MPKPTPESARLASGDLEEQLRELHLITALLATVADMIGVGIPVNERLKTETAAWLIFEAAQRAERAHETFLNQAEGAA